MALTPTIAFSTTRPPEDGVRVVLADDHPIVLAGIRTLLNADPEVMRHFPATKDAAASRAEARTCARRFAVDGFGPWAVTVEGRGFVGMIGGARLLRPMPFPLDRPRRTRALVARKAAESGVAVHVPAAFETIHPFAAAT